MQKTLINGKYELFLPEHRVARPEWVAWEVERIDAMVKTIKSTDVVFDLGVELGDITALLAKYTGCKMVFFEPNPLAYPAIKAIWQANNLPQPLDFYRGFASDKTTGWYYLPNNSFDDIDVNDMIPNSGFAALSDGRPDIVQITLDDYCSATGIYPDVITMDVEGSEALVLRGAEKTLREKKPVIFMSVHPEFMYESYRNEGIWKEKYGERQHVVHMLRFIDELGYRHECIEYDYHELHMKFIPL